MLFSIEQSILAEETLANLRSFAKSANVSTLQSFPPYGTKYAPAHVISMMHNKLVVQEIMSSSNFIHVTIREPYTVS